MSAGRGNVLRLQANNLGWSSAGSAFWGGNMHIVVKMNSSAVHQHHGQIDTSATNKIEASIAKLDCHAKSTPTVSEQKTLAVQKHLLLETLQLWSHLLGIGAHREALRILLRVLWGWLSGKPKAKPWLGPGF